MDERRLELKVGALALVALGVGVALVVVLTGVLTGERTRLHADFGYAGGLPEGALVKFAGVKVGRIAEVEFRPEARDAQGRSVPVRLAIDIDPAAARALRADATAAVGAQGALGEVHLELLPGTSPEPLPPGAPLRGLDPPRLDVLLSRLYSLLDSSVNDEAFRAFLVEVSKFAGKLNVLASENKDEIKSVLADLSAILGDARAMMGDARAVARSTSQLLSKPEVAGLVTDLSVTAKAAREELPPMLSETRALMARLDATVGALTPEDVAQVRATLAKLDELAAKLNEVSAGAGSLLAGIEKGEGTAGRLVKDPKVYDDLRALLADLKAHPWKLVWKN